MKNKLLSIVLATIIMSETSYAAANYLSSVLDNSLMNVTPGGTIVQKDASGNVKSTTFHTTSVYFRFGPGLSYPEPMFNISPPQISAGCHGLSVKGMFASIISLSQLEEQLKNGGASLAWGIVVGLIYSLPGIGAAFRMIDTWAKKIQQLLGNMCSMGQNIGAAMGNAGWGPDTALGKSIASGSAEITKALEFPKGMSKEHFGLKMDFDNMTLVSAAIPPTDPSQVKENWKNKMISLVATPSMSTNVLSAALVKMPNGNRLDFIKTAFGVELDQVNAFDETIIYLTLDKTDTGVYNTESVVHLLSGLSTYEQDDIARSFTQAALAKSLSGDLVLSKSDYSVFLGQLKILLDPASTDTQKKAASTKLNDSVEPGAPNPFIYSKDNDISTPTGVLTKIINYLVKGYIPGESNDLGVKALGYHVIAIPVNIEDSGNSQNMVYVISALPNASTVGDWFHPKPTDKGARDRSRLLIEGLGLGGTAPTADLDALEASSKIGLLVPGVINKIKVIQQTPPKDKFRLTEMAIDYNAYHTVLASINGFMENGSIANPAPAIFINKSGVMVKEGKGVSVTPDHNKQYTDIKTAASTVMGEAVKTAKDVLKSTVSEISLAELEDRFNAQDLKNKSEAIKVAPGK